MNVKVILTEDGIEKYHKKEIVLLDLKDGDIKVSSFAREIYIKEDALTTSVFNYNDIKRIELLLVGFNEMEDKKYEDARKILGW